MIKPRDYPNCYAWLQKKSPDGHRIARVASMSDSSILGGGEAYELDGVIGPVFEFVGPGVFSLNSKHFAHPAQRQGKWHVVTNGHIGPAFDCILRIMQGPWGSDGRDPIVFSIDNQHTAYLGYRNGFWHVVVDDVVMSDSYKLVDNLCLQIDASSRFAKCFGCKTLGGGKDEDIEVAVPERPHPALAG